MTEETQAWYCAGCQKGALDVNMLYGCDFCDTCYCDACEDYEEYKMVHNDYGRGEEEDWNMCRQCAYNLVKKFKSFKVIPTFIKDNEPWKNIESYFDTHCGTVKVSNDVDNPKTECSNPDNINL